MKKSTRFLALAAALVLMVSLLAVPASAKDYEFYQIFTGTQTTNTADPSYGKLANVQWGSAVPAAKVATFLNTVKSTSTSITDTTTAAELAAIVSAMTDAQRSNFAKAVYTYIRDNGPLTKFSNDDVNNNTLPNGYYLVNDATTLGLSEAKNTAFLYLTNAGQGNPLTAIVKTSAPELQKKLKDINDTEDDSILDNPWKDSADHDIGDDVPMQLKATFPNGINDNFPSYTITFHDELNKGYTYNPTTDGFTATIHYPDNTTKDVTNKFTPSTVTTDATTGDQTFSFTYNEDLKPQNITPGTYITIEYNAELNTNCVIGPEGNPSKARLEFTSNPNEPTETNYTPWDDIRAFTHVIQVTKVDQDGNPLPGPKFDLYKKDSTGTYVKVGAFANDETSATPNIHTYVGVDDGEYKIVESYTLPGYNDLDDVYFKVINTHDEDSSSAYAADALGYTVSADQGATYTADSTTNPLFALSSGQLSTTVVNQIGITLPKTGGTGTTMLYAIGGMLFLGAIIVLVARKRVGAE